MKKIITIKKREHIIKTKNYKNFVGSKYFIFYYDKCIFNCVKEEEINSNGCVLIINTKKNCKTSVKRNLLKRRIKEILVKVNFSFSLVIYSKPLAFISDFHILKENIIYLIEKIQRR
jgi:ribonuclease P protein component